MKSNNTLIADKAVTAKRLIESHYTNDSKMKSARLFLSDQDDVIRILELTDAVPSCDELSPFSFAPAKQYGIAFPSSVILVNSKDWEKIAKHKLALPSGWDEDKAQDVERN